MSPSKVSALLVSYNRSVLSLQHLARAVVSCNHIVNPKFYPLNVITISTINWLKLFCCTGDGGTCSGKSRRKNGQASSSIKTPRFFEGLMWCVLEMRRKNTINKVSIFIRCALEMINTQINDLVIWL